MPKQKKPSQEKRKNDPKAALRNRSLMQAGSGRGEVRDRKTGKMLPKATGILSADTYSVGAEHRAREATGFDRRFTDKELKEFEKKYPRMGRTDRIYRNIRDKIDRERDKQSKESVTGPETNSTRARKRKH